MGAGAGAATSVSGRGKWGSGGGALSLLLAGTQREDSADFPPFQSFGWGACASSCVPPTLICGAGGRTLRLMIGSESTMLLDSRVGGP